MSPPLRSALAATQALICMQIPSCAKVLSKQVAWALAKGKKGDEGEERGKEDVAGGGWRKKKRRVRGDIWFGLILT